MRLTIKESVGDYKPKVAIVPTHNIIVDKLGQLEDLMEKYNIKTVGQVEGAFIGFVSDYTEEGRNHIGELLKFEEELGIDLRKLGKVLEIIKEKKLLKDAILECSTDEYNEYARAVGLPLITNAEMEIIEKFFI